MLEYSNVLFYSEEDESDFLENSELMGVRGHAQTCSNSLLSRWPMANKT